MADLTKIFKFSRAELLVLLEAWFVFLKWDLLISFTRYENWRDKLGAFNDDNQAKNPSAQINSKLNSQPSSQPNSQSNTPHSSQHNSRPNPEQNTKQNPKQSPEQSSQSPQQNLQQSPQQTVESTTNTASTIEQVKALIKLSEIAGRFHIRKMNCLRRCISQEKMLEKRGFQPCMHIGVRFENEQLKAHAWLTLQGIVINDSEDVATRYSELKANNPHVLLRQLA